MVGTRVGTHKEDTDLNSINYVIFGEKVFFFIPKEEGWKLDCLAKYVKEKDEKHKDIPFVRCQGIFHHRYLYISPALLKYFNISFKMVRQQANEGLLISTGITHWGKLKL